MGEKRGYIRYALEGDITWKPEGDSSGAVKGRLLDISFSGVSVFLKESVDNNTIVQFDFSTNLIEHHFLGKAKIIHVKKQKLYHEDGFKIGLEFIEVNKGLVLSLVNRIQSKICEEARRRWQTMPKDVGPI